MGKKHNLEYRMERAKITLKSDLAISKVSKKAGYMTPEAFSKAFKMYTGTSPREYRKQFYLEQSPHYPCKELIETLVKGMSPKTSVDSLYLKFSKKSKLSKKRFTFLFSKHMGISPKSYITKLKIEKSIELLSSGIKIKEVSKMIGYTNITSLSRQFKRLGYKQPREYFKLSNNSGEPQD